MNARKTILVLYPDEVNACIAQFPWLANGANWLCLTIDALDRCLQLRLAHAQMPAWLQAAGTFSADEYQSWFSKFQDLEENLIEQRKSIGFNEHAYWNHQHNMILLGLLSSAQKTAALAKENLSQSAPLYILQRAGVGDYHYSGGLLAAIVQDTLKRAGFQIETIYLPLSGLVSAYSPTVYSQIPDYWSAEVSNSWQQSDSNVLVSPCGVFYKPDQQKLLQLLQKLGVTSKGWMLSPPFWSVIPDGSGFKPRISVQAAYENLSPSMQHALTTMVDGMTVATDALMREILGDQLDGMDFYRHQIQRIRQRHLFQCLTFLGLAHLCSIKPMEALVVSNLDGGINGPLFSAAQEGASPCYMLPHSRVINQPSDGPCTIVTEYWQPIPSVSHRGDENAVIHMSSEKISQNPVGFCQEHRRHKVLILFNGIHRWTSLNTSLDFLRKTVSDIKRLCLAAGVDLMYRLKPGDQTPLDAYSCLLGIDRDVCQLGLTEPLNVLLENTELVIAIDDPSSALWEAIELGCAVVLMADRPFIPSTLLDGEILQSYPPEQGMGLISQLLKNKKQLDQLRQSQFSKLHALRQSRLAIHAT